MKNSMTCIALVACMIFASGCAAQSASKGSGAKAVPTQGSATTNSAGLMDPTKAVKVAPATFRVKFETTKGDFVVQINRSWAPKGADRFYNLVDTGYFKDIAIFRAISGFMFQFGIHGDPAVNKKWSNSNIKDDPYNRISNEKGYLTFAHAGPNTRSTQMFINLRHNRSLDRKFPPIGEVVSGMDVVEKINTEYGENPRGENIQGNFEAKGNKYIMSRFPNLDVIKSVTIVK